mmetsp:Transcript_61322/g.171492  ORF Transcript_61322/g.171492 Transcript_61322/m.171492 type:complete len:248 (-) Transcript_61322:18-761(-)
MTRTSRPLHTQMHRHTQPRLVLHDATRSFHMLRARLLHSLALHVATINACCLLALRLRVSRGSQTPLPRVGPRAVLLLAFAALLSGGCARRLHDRAVRARAGQRRKGTLVVHAMPHDGLAALLPVDNGPLPLVQKERMVVQDRCVGLVPRARSGRLGFPPLRGSESLGEQPHLHIALLKELVVILQALHSHNESLGELGLLQVCGVEHGLLAEELLLLLGARLEETLERRVEHCLRLVLLCLQVSQR